MEFRRKREGKTDYRKRIKSVASGEPRLVVRRRLNNFTVQLISYAHSGDITAASAHSRELRTYKYEGHLGNVKSAYLTGFLCGKRALGNGYKEAVLDIGRATPIKGSNVFAALKGAVDAGLKISHTSEVLPAEDRIKGVEKIIESIKKKSRVSNERRQKTT